ncbi:MAG: acyltransferase domain-containing protein [Cyclobacteriaceae bacterium]
MEKETFLTAPKYIHFLFPGHGSERVDMMRQMYEEVEIFRDEVDTCLNLVDQNLDFDLRGILFPEPGKEEFAQQHIHQTETAQPALFVVEYGLAKVLTHLGIAPFSMLGHSVSEYVAACLAEVFSLKTAIEIVVKRGQLVQKMPEGSMLAIALPESEVIPHLTSRIALGSTIGENQCVVSGFPDSIEALNQHLNAQGVICKQVRVTRAFHSMMLDPILEEFRDFVAQKPIKAPKKKYISGVTGQWIDANDVQTAQYWVDQLRNPVRFYEGITELSKVEDSLFLEVGKGGMLTSMVKAHPLISEESQCFLTCPPTYMETEDVPFFWQTLDSLSSLGFVVDKTPLKLEGRAGISLEKVKPSSFKKSQSSESVVSAQSI